MIKTNNGNREVRVALYIRVSTDEQAKHGYGIEMQKQALLDTVKHKAKYNNWVSKEEWIYIDDGYTGSNLERPEYKKMMKAVKNNEFDIIAVWKIDRMSRNLTHLLHVFETLQKFNSSFYSLKENIDFSGAIGKLTFQIFGALAEFERETIRTRTVEGKIASARMGNWTGAGIPYGYKAKENPGKGKVLVMVKDEAKRVKEIFDWFIYDKKNYRQIAEKLNELKVAKGVASSQKRHRNSKWSDVVVRGMIFNQTYTGRRLQKMKDGDGDVVEIIVRVPQIINDLVFRQAQYHREYITKTKGKRGGGQNVYLLSRKIIDLETGRKLIGYTRGKGGIGYRRKGFIDSIGKKFRNKEIPGKPLDDFVWEQIKLAINKPKEFFKIYQKQTVQNRELERNENSIAISQIEIERAENSLNIVFEDYYNGKLSETRKEGLEAKYKAIVDSNKKRIDKLNKEIERITEIEIASNALKEFSKSFKQKLNNLTIEQKQLIVELLVEKVEVFEDEENIRINVIFKFAHDSQNKGEVLDEPKKGLSKTKNTSNEMFSDVDGGRTRIRT